MIRVAGHFLECSIYVYPSDQAAAEGHHAGGSGFLTHVAGAQEPVVHVYAATNKHVLDKGGHFLRLNSEDGGHRIIKTNPGDWFHHPDGDDVAVLPITLEPEHKWASVSCDDYVTEEMVKTNVIGLGDETFLIGRLSPRSGKVQNKPTVRFGRLAMMEDTIWREWDGQRQRSFLVDGRSMSGFSGSPVFVVRSGELDVTVNISGRLHVSRQTPRRIGISLLGINWCHIKDEQKVGPTSESAATVEVNSGVMGVVPAWRLRELLFSPVLVEMRAEAEDALPSDQEHTG